MNEFLNPKSMVTPGVAGAMAMLIANSVVSQFPEAPFRWVMVALSFMIGTVVFYAVTMPLMQRCAFWAVNSLIIFSVGIGTSNVAANVQRAAAQGGTASSSSVLDLLVPSAHAQQHSSAELPSIARPASATALDPLSVCESERRALAAELRSVKAELAALSAPPAAAVKGEVVLERHRPEIFFKRW